MFNRPGLDIVILISFIGTIIRVSNKSAFNGNTPKNRNNRTKRLALLGRCLSR